MKTIISNCTYTNSSIKEQLNKYKNCSNEELMKIKPKINKE